MESQATNNESIIFKKIKLLLVERNMQFKELAEHVGMTPQGLRLSLKRNKVSFETIRKIAYCLKTSAQYLADDSKITSSAPIKSQKDLINEMAAADEPLQDFISKTTDELYRSLARIAIYEDVIRYFASKYPNEPVSKLLEDRIRLHGLGLFDLHAFRKELHKVLSE